MKQYPPPTPTMTAAKWLAEQPEHIPHTVRVLKEKFGLTAKEACDAIATARGSAKPDKTESTAHV